MKAQSHSRVTRRQFLLTGIGGAALATATSLGWRSLRSARTNRISDKTVLVRNPAFVRQRWVDKLALVTTTQDGQQLVYEIDEGAAFLWEQTPTTDDFRDGTRRTVGDILDVTVRHYPNREEATIRTDALGFIQEAILAGVFANDRMKISVTCSRVARA